jgi:DNA-binding CsgD family transcriptional regulator
MIYDASMDDGALEQLSVNLATYLGARSGVIHWQEAASEGEHASFSGYYSSEHMAVYARDFSDADLWANAVSNDALTNRAINLAQVVSPRDYENSRIYNEWIRPMGDDTFHCLGATLKFEGIEGQVGFHRGRRQLAFDDAATARLQEMLGHIRRMIAVRTRVSHAQGKADAMSGTLNALSDALFTLDGTGRLLFCNAAGEAMLEEGVTLRLERRRLSSSYPQTHKLLVSAISKATAASGAQASTFRQPRSSGGYYLFSVIGSASDFTRSVTVCVSASQAADPMLERRLRSLYRLTQAEAEVAVGIAAGVSVSKLAEARGRSMGTLRTQVKSVACKLGCSRQAEIAALVNGIPRLSGC